MTRGMKRALVCGLAVGLLGGAVGMQGQPAGGVAGGVAGAGGRSVPYSVGEQVEALRGGKWTAAAIRRVGTKGYYYVEWLDALGELGDWVLPAEIRREGGKVVRAKPRPAGAPKPTTVPYEPKGMREARVEGAEAPSEPAAPAPQAGVLPAGVLPGTGRRSAEGDSRVKVAMAGVEQLGYWKMVGGKEVRGKVASEAEVEYRLEAVKEPVIGEGRGPVGFAVGKETRVKGFELIGGGSTVAVVGYSRQPGGHESGKGIERDANELAFVDLATTSVLRTVRWNGRPVRSFSPDGELAIAAANGEANAFEVFDVSGSEAKSVGVVQLEFASGPNTTWEKSFSRYAFLSRTEVLASGPGRVAVFRIASLGEKKPTMGKGSVQKVWGWDTEGAGWAFVSSGRNYVGMRGGEGEVLVFDVAGKLAKRLAFSPVGRMEERWEGDGFTPGGKAILLDQYQVLDLGTGALISKPAEKTLPGWTGIRSVGGEDGLLLMNQYGQVIDGRRMEEVMAVPYRGTRYGGWLWGFYPAPTSWRGDEAPKTGGELMGVKFSGEDSVAAATQPEMVRVPLKGARVKVTTGVPAESRAAVQAVIDKWLAKVGAVRTEPGESSAVELNVYLEDKVVPVTFEGADASEVKCTMRLVRMQLTGGWRQDAKSGLPLAGRRVRLVIPPGQTPKQYVDSLLVPVEKMMEGYELPAEAQINRSQLFQPQKLKDPKVLF